MRCSPVAATSLLVLLMPVSWSRAACDLSLSVDPPELSPGKRTARVRVVTNGAKPQLVASAGELKNLRRDGSSAFVADYVPPSQGNQRLAVVAAALDGGACGFGAVRLGFLDLLGTVRHRIAFLQRGVDDGAAGPEARQEKQQ